MNTMGTIKFLEDKIITKKGELVEVWIKSKYPVNIYIEYKGIIYNLITEVNSDSEEI